MGKILGADGEKAASQAQGQEEVPNFVYAVGGVEMATPEVPEVVLQRAVIGAKQITGQQAGQAAMAQLNDHSMAQQAANAAANACNNPFAIEPAALATFMLMSREIEWRDKVIAQLAERLDKLDGESSEALLKKPWPQQEAQGENAREGDAFDDAVKNLSGNDGD